MRYCAEPGGGAKHDLSGKLLQLLKKWPASAALSWDNLRGLRQQHRTTCSKLRLRSCAHGYTLAERVPENAKR